MVQRHANSSKLLLLLSHPLIQGEIIMETAVTSQEAFDLTLIAFGSGTGGIYVKPEVVGNLRTLLFQNFQDEINNWESQKLFVLECARAIGRLAAQNAVSKGYIAIKWIDCAKPAFEKVIQEYGGGVPGNWCRIPT